MKRSVSLCLLAAICVAIALGSSPRRASGWSAGVPQAGPSGGVHRELTRHGITRLSEDGWRFRGESIDPSARLWQLAMDGAVVPDALHLFGVTRCTAVEQLEYMLDKPVPHDCILGILVCGGNSPLCDAVNDDFEDLESHGADRMWDWLNRAREALADNNLERAFIRAGYATHFAEDWTSPSHLEGLWDEPDPSDLWWPSPLAHPHTVWELEDEGFLDKAPSEDLRGEKCLPGDLHGSWEDYRASIVREWPLPPSTSLIRQWGDPDDGAFDSRITEALKRGSMLARYIAADVFDLTPPADCPAPASSVDVVLIIDSSGSMTWNDPANKRLDAAKAYLTASLEGDFVGVVDFDGSVRVASPLQRLPDAKTNLVNAINTINSSGSTNIGIGIQAGCDVLVASTSENTTRAAILLTDGQGSFGGQDSCFKDRGWPIFTFGFGSANDALLQQIASNTGGEFKRLPTSDLVCEFQRVRSKIAGMDPGPCTAILIEPGATTTFLAAVPAAQAQATFSTSWTGSDVVMTLTTPSGRVIDRNTVAPDIVHDKGLAFEVYTITGPEAGDWEVNLFGADVPAGGEEVIFGLTMVPASNIPPSLNVPGEQNVQYSDPLSFSVSASDPDDLPESLRFSATGLCDGLALIDNLDGTASVEGVVQSGAGTCNAEVTVTDLDGLTDTDTVPIVVSKEDALLDYIGDTLVTVGSPVTLRTSVAEVADGSLGDITNAAVFFDVTASIGGGTTSYGPTAASASGEAAWTVPTGLPANVYSVDVRMDPANPYYQAEPAVTAALVVYDPSAGFTTGGGWVTDGGEKGNFGFSVKYVGKRNNIRGQALYVYRDGDSVTRVKGNAMQWLVINGNTAVFRGKATVNDVGNHTFEITIVDNGEPGASDTFAIEIWQPDGTLLHEVPPTLLGGGNIVVPHPKGR